MHVSRIRSKGKRKKQLVKFFVHVYYGYVANGFLIFSVLLYSAVSILDCIVTNGGTVHHYKTGKDLEGNSRDVMKVVTQRVTVEGQRKSTKTPVGNHSIPAQS
jgi:hypothetical protein